MQIQNVQSPSFQSKTFISPKIQKKLNRLVYKMNKSTIYQDEPTLFGAKILAGVHTEKGAVYNTADNAIVHINDKISVYIDKENGEVKKVKKPLFAGLKNIILKCEQTIYEANKNFENNLKVKKHFLLMPTKEEFEEYGQLLRALLVSAKR